VRHDLRAALRVRPADAAWAFALRAGLVIAVPLAVLVASGRTSWAPFATFGAFAALYGRDELYRRRAVLVGASGAGLVLAVAAGGLAALGPPVVGVFAVALVGAVATLLCNRFRTGPPAGLMFAFATAVCSALPTAPGDLPLHVGLTAGSALLAWLIVTSGVLITPDAPRRLAVARALRAAAALHAAPEGTVGLQARHRAALAVERAWRAVGDSARPRHSARPRRETSAPGSGGLRGERSVGGFGGRWGEALAGDSRDRRRSASVADSGRLGGEVREHADQHEPDVVLRGEEPSRDFGGLRDEAEAGLEVLVAHAETELSGVHGHSAEAAAELRGLADRLTGRGAFPRLAPTAIESAKISERRLARILLRDRAPSRGPLGPAAARVALGALAAGAVAGLLTHFTGLGHPYWAAVSAVAVLQAASLRLSRQRALQRAGGTILGLLIAGGAVAIPGGPWVLVAAIVVAQVVAELLVIRNYGLAMLAVTPLALLVGELGRKSPPLDLIGDRLVQTVIGCLLGLAAAAVVSNRAAGRHLDDATAAVEEATAALGSEPGEARRLALLVAGMREAYEVAAGEPGLSEEAVERVLVAERAARSALVRT
jgi:uncharacterized membrane protein YccC